MNSIVTFIKLLLYKMLPTKKNRYVFTAYDGYYSDSPKNISEKLHLTHPDIEIVWLVDASKFVLLPDYVQKVDISSIKAEWYRDTAFVLVDNVYGGRSYVQYGNSVPSRLKAKIYRLLCFKKSQKIYSTWHGVALKRMGRDQIGNEDIVDFVCGNLDLLLGNSYTADIMDHLTFGHCGIKVLGSPRNDVLFDVNKRSQQKSKLNLPMEKKVVLFAPTFRNDGKDVADKNVFRSGLNQLKEIDFDRLFFTLSKKFGGEWVFVCRFHYHVSAMVDWDMLCEKYNGRVINGNLHDDMADYLVCTDVLITDVSSAMFDFAVTEKPCFLYFPDLERYRTQERGFYMPINSLPYSTAEKFNDLLDNIERFDIADYVNQVRRLKEKLGFAEDGHAAERIVDYITRGDKC